MGDTRPKAKEPDLFVPLIPDAAQSVVGGGGAIADAHVTTGQIDVVSVTRIIRIACPIKITLTKSRLKRYHRI